MGMQTTPNTPTLDDLLRHRLREILPSLLPELLPEIRAAIAPPERASDGLRMLTIPQLQKRFSIGRKQLNSLIYSGRLPATTRVMRGGREGFVVRMADAERVLAGAQK